MADDEMEYTLLNKRDVLVYQIPPASSSSGHKADDWKKCIWRGRCVVTGKGQDLAVSMLDASSGALFAKCSIPGGNHEQYVESVVDSSRYFVLKVTNGARHAFIGIGFEDRNDAFDFKCTLSDFKRPEVEDPAPTTEQAPAKDFSLKEGQKITVNLGNLGGSRRQKKAESTADAGSGGFGFLAPPPSGGQSRRQQQAAPLAPPAAPLAAAPAAASVAAAAPAPSFQDDFDDFGDFTAAPAAQSAAAAMPTPAVAMPAAAVMPAPAPAAAKATTTSGLADSLAGLDLGAFGTPAAAPVQTPQPMMGAAAPMMGAMGAAPTMGSMSAPTSAMGAAAPMMSSPAKPQAAGMGAMGAIGGGMGGGFGGGMGMGSSPAPAASKSADPFSGFDMLGGLGGSSSAPAAQPQGMAAFAPPQQKPKGGSDPFGDLDIFK